MNLVNDVKNPELLGVNASIDDARMVERMVANLNQSLIDSGYEKYQYEVKTNTDRIYISPV